MPFSDHREPFVLYGSNSGRKSLEAAQTEGTKSSNITPEGAGVHGAQALHMVHTCINTC